MDGYNCSTCSGGTPCCWENPATWLRQTESAWRKDTRIPPRDVVRRWRWGWLPRIRITVLPPLRKAHRAINPT